MPPRSTLALTTLLVAALLAPRPAHATDWPADAASTPIGEALRASITDFEPSGIAWHAGRGTFIVVGDGGDIGEITPEGGLVNAWSPGQNLESIAIADVASSIVYVGGENESTIYAFDLDTGEYTGAAWDISDHVYPVEALGFEALAWVPDGAHAYGDTPSGGVFYAGWQYDADLYVFAPDLAGTDITYLDQIRTTMGYSDLASLDFNAATGTLFAMYDAPDRLEELDVATGVPLATYTVPETGAWEGIAMRDGCPTSTIGALTLANDMGSVVTFANFPFACLVVDADGDGVYSDADCDEADPAASTVGIAWPDADGDGYGDPAAGTSLCGTPDGYVLDDTDCDDANAAAHPGADDVPGDGVDQDCDGLDAVVEDSGGAGDSGVAGDSAELGDSGGAGDRQPGCGCVSTPGVGFGAGILGLVGVIGRRRR